MKIVTAYTLFACFATVINIGVQDVAGRMYCGANAIIVSVAAGTIAGLFVKYLLDKRYIFLFRPNDALHDGRTFLLYSAMGIVTTVIFWVFELGFNFLFHTKELRYLGGVIGLAIGYFSKYQLDKRFVFRQGSTA
ncbi:MAG: GtrA family protein [Chlorobium sp.]|nr:MAG: GtrA family protein [Chlorobium sp.]